MFISNIKVLRKLCFVENVKSKDDSNFCVYCGNEINALKVQPQNGTYSLFLLRVSRLTILSS